MRTCRQREFMVFVDLNSIHLTVINLSWRGCVRHYCNIDINIYCMNRNVLYIAAPTRHARYLCFYSYSYTQYVYFLFDLLCSSFSLCQVCQSYAYIFIPRDSAVQRSYIISRLFRVTDTNEFNFYFFIHGYFFFIDFILTFINIIK